MECPCSSAVSLDPLRPTSQLTLHVDALLDTELSRGLLDLLREAPLHVLRRELLRAPSSARGRDRRDEIGGFAKVLLCELIQTDARGDILV